MDDFLVSIAPIIIDDILTYEGLVYLSLLGGGGIHALAGCRVWNKKLGIIAGVGEDFHDNLRDLSRIGIDPGGLIYFNQETPRAWQIIQPGDIRIQILRDPKVKIIQIDPDFNGLDSRYQNAAGYHILWRGTNDRLFNTLANIRNKNPHAIIVFEPTPDYEKKETEYYKQLYKLIDVFTPNFTEGRQITGYEDPYEIIQELINAGCRTVALRMGENGSVGYAMNSAKAIKVPAAESTVQDVTGAGNAFAGGLLCGLVRGKTLVESLAMASVSASFAIQQFGICFYTDQLNSLRDMRLKQVLQKATTVSV
jgi:ribokinase